MVLRITVINAGFLREAVQAVPVGVSGMVIIIWSPDYFAVQSLFTERMPIGENPATLLKIAPESFSSYDSTDPYFNAIIEAAVLEAVFHAAMDSDPIEFCRFFEDNGMNGFGYLHARFNRPVDLVAGAFVNDYISMKIYGILPDEVVKSADISRDVSPIPLRPVARFRAYDFAECMATLESFGTTVMVAVLENQVFFSKKERPLDLLMMKHGTGLISTREDCKFQPIPLEIHMQNLDLQPGAGLSDEVSLFKFAENEILIWFKLALLQGNIFYYVY